MTETFHKSGAIAQLTHIEALCQGTEGSASLPEHWNTRDPNSAVRDRNNNLCGRKVQWPAPSQNPNIQLQWNPVGGLANLFTHYSLGFLAFCSSSIFGIRSTSFRNIRDDPRVVFLSPYIIAIVIMVIVTSLTPSTGVFCGVSQVLNSRIKCPFTRRKREMNWQRERSPVSIANKNRDYKDHFQ